MPVISVYTIKGGVGKTTIIQLLAIGLATRGYKVLLIDADLQADLSYRLLGEVHNTFSVFSKTNYGLGAITLSNLHAAPRQIVSNLDIIPMEPDALVKTDERLITNFEFLEQDQLLTKYDYILIDTPPSYDIIVAQNILRQSDFVFTIVTPSTQSIRIVNLELTRVLPAISSMIKRPAKFLGIIRNMIHTTRYVVTEQTLNMLSNLEETCQKSNITKYTPCLFETVVPQRGVLGQNELRELLLVDKVRQNLLRRQVALASLVREFTLRIKYLTPQNE